MAWERRGGRRYFYEGRREGARVVKTYRGRGAKAFAVAALVVDGRAAREADATAARALAEELGAVDQCMRDLDGRADMLAAAALMAAGYYEHRGQWRKRGAGKDSYGSEEHDVEYGG